MDKYNEFLDEYAKLCRETGYYFNTTEGGFLGVFRVDRNEADFQQQIKDLGGSND